MRSLLGLQLPTPIPHSASGVMIHEEKLYQVYVPLWIGFWPQSQTTEPSRALLLSSTTEFLVVVGYSGVKRQKRIVVRTSLTRCSQKRILLIFISSLTVH